jgi:hypothetical protein
VILAIETRYLEDALGSKTKYLWRSPTSDKRQSRYFGRRPAPSGLPRSTDILGVRQHVSKVPDPDMADDFAQRTAARRRLVVPSAERNVEATLPAAGD